MFRRAVSGTCLLGVPLALAAVGCSDQAPPNLPGPSAPVVSTSPQPVQSVVGSTERPVVSSTSLPIRHLDKGPLRSAPPLRADQLPNFALCPRVAAPEGTTNLHPVARIGTANDRMRQVRIPHGTVTVEQVARVRLAGGWLSAGSGFDVTSGWTDTWVRVRPKTLTAPVTLAVLNSPTSGRRVAFAELQLDVRHEPDRWVRERSLSIGTDGGDGGFLGGGATVPSLDDAESLADDALHVWYPKNSTDYSNICLRRIEPTGVISGVDFATGYGDGGYPTFLGLDKTGAVVSVVNFGYVLPWRDAGLPGTPPPNIDD